MRFAVLCVIVIAAVLGLVPAIGRPVRAQATVQIVVACAADHSVAGFSVLPAAEGGETAVVPTDPAAAVLDAATPLVAVTCQAVLWNPSAAPGAQFALDPGEVTYTVTGPGFIVESAGPEYSAPCGSPGAAGSCSGAFFLSAGSDAPAVPTTVGGAPGLTIHLALAPAAILPALPAAGATEVEADFAGAAGSAVAMTHVDIGSAHVMLSLDSDRAIIGSGPGDVATVTARLRHLVPGSCDPIQGGPFMVCSDATRSPAPGAEAGTLVFTTSLGLFSNDMSRVEAACGGQATTPLAVPPPGGPGPVAFSCTEVRVQLHPAGRAGDAVIAVRFDGLVTGASAETELHINVVPGAPAVQLPPGCNDVSVPAGFPPAGTVDLLLDSISPRVAVTAIWVQAPDTGVWLAAYLRVGDAPTDGVTLVPGGPIVVCADAPVQYPIA